MLARAALLLALVALAGCAAPPSVDHPVRFLPGNDAGPGVASPYVTTYHLAPDGSTFDIGLAGVPEATLAIGSLVRIANEDGVAHAITLRGPRVGDPAIAAFRVAIPGADGPLDLLALAPELHVTIPPRGALDADVTLTLASGAHQPVAVSALTLDVMSP